MAHTSGPAGVTEGRKWLTNKDSIAQVKKFDGDTVSIDRFGASAPGPVCLEKFGFTVDNVVAKAKALG